MPPVLERCLFDKYPPPTSWIISVGGNAPEPVLQPFLQAWPCSAPVRGTQNLPGSFGNPCSITRVAWRLSDSIYGKAYHPSMHISNEFPMIQGVVTLKHNICTDADAQLHDGGWGTQTLMHRPHDGGRSTQMLMHSLHDGGKRTWLLTSPAASMTGQSNTF